MSRTSISRRRSSASARDEDIDVTLPRDGVAGVVDLSDTPRRDDEEEYILLGDTEKYVPIASEYKVKKLVSELPL